MYFNTIFKDQSLLQDSEWLPRYYCLDTIVGVLKNCMRSEGMTSGKYHLKILPVSGCLKINADCRITDKCQESLWFPKDPTVISKEQNQCSGMMDILLKCDIHSKLLNSISKGLEKSSI